MEACPPQFFTIPPQTLPVIARVDVDSSRSNLNTLRGCRNGGKKSRCSSDGECILTQTDNDLTGTCKTAEGKDAKASGKVDGDKITWSFDSDYNGTPLTIKYEGKLDVAAGKISTNSP